jgi:hypothetical protein
MVLKIVLISIVLVALAGIGLAIKYYRSKHLPLCYRQGKEHQFVNGVCSICGKNQAEYNKI